MMESAISNPKVAALMAQLQSKSVINGTPSPDVRIRKGSVAAPGATTDKQAPKTFDDFLKLEHLNDWPTAIDCEGPLGIQSEGEMLGSVDDIMQILMAAAPLPLEKFDHLEERLLSIEEILNRYASQILNETSISWIPDHIDTFRTKRQTFLTEVDGITRGKNELANAILKENKKGSIVFASFPGFHNEEPMELPGQLEAPPILHRVTKAQDFNPGFRKIWKKVFLSEASVAVLQDAFWWFFISKFEKKRTEEQNRLFDRIADSFVALFTSINTDIKDKFLIAYPDCLSQAILTIFLEAFPESRGCLDDKLKQDLVNTVYEWTAGIKPLPGQFNKWNIRRLLGQPVFDNEGDATVKAVQIIQQPTGESSDKRNKNKTAGLDIEGFEKYVEKLYEQYAPTDRSTDSPSLVTRDAVKVCSPSGSHLPSYSRLGQWGTPKKLPVESHQIGPGPEFEKVKFNLHGRSPLVAHYLHRRQLRDYHQPGKKVQRTEIASLPPPGKTYKQVIQETLAFLDCMNKEYQKICEQTTQDILELEKQKRETNREIDKMKHELLYCKNSLDLKILSERIIELREREKDSDLLKTSKKIHQSRAEPVSQKKSNEDNENADDKSND